MTLAMQLAQLVVGWDSGALPSRALEHAAMLVASTVASAAMGSTIESARIVRQLEVERGGAQEATAWFGHGERLPAPAAARIHALASDAAASDDSHLDYITHQGTTAVSCALAVGEKTGASGADVLASIVMGYEATSRVMQAAGYAFKAKGFHGSIASSFAGTAAAARLERLDARQAAHAFALTATSMGGLTAAADTSWAREYHAGQAALVAVHSVLAASRGFEAELAVFEMPKGFLAIHGGDGDPTAISRAAGERWSILEDLAIKLVPGGHPYHAIAEAAARAARSGDVRPEQVEEVVVSRSGYQGLAVLPVTKDLIGIAHSPLYFAAAGIVDRGFGWSHATEEKIANERIHALLGKVRLEGAPTRDIERFRLGAVVKIRTRDGRTHEGIAYAPRGSATLGIEWPDVEEKYRALVPHTGLTHGQIDASLAAIRGLHKAPHVSSLAALLREA